jgi:predicted AAA+ superfamily ATPase
MFQRLFAPPQNNSFFLFGARGTGKSTFLKNQLALKNVLWIDLLHSKTEDLYRLHPEELAKQVQADKKIKWVIIDEVQKIPRLLDTIHELIESTKTKFILTGSSARKLKSGGANLLAGRAFVYNMHPLTHVELGNQFSLDTVLTWGSLPQIFSLNNDSDKTEFLDAYALTYLKEEIWTEHIIRKLDPFRRFLEVAAQTSGDIINYSNIADDVGADIKTVQSYYQILEDTWVGFLLPAYHKSVRKQQNSNPKFYFFDVGVKRILDHSLGQKVTPHTYGYGKLFEHFVILECLRLNSYLRKRFRFFTCVPIIKLKSTSLWSARVCRLWLSKLNQKLTWTSVTSKLWKIFCLILTAPRD